MGDVAGPFSIPPNVRTMTRPQIAAAMASLPPASQLMTNDDLSFLIQNADLLRDDYAGPLVAVADATPVGERATVVRYGIGFAVGALVGFLACKVLG